MLPLSCAALYQVVLDAEKLSSGWHSTRGLFDDAFNAGRCSGR